MAERMIITVLEAHVAKEKCAQLTKIFSDLGEHLPSQIVHSWLLQSESDPTIWRAMSLWKSRAALQEYRRSVETPGGVLIFRSVGAEPSLSIFEIAAEQEPALIQR